MSRGVKLTRHAAQALRRMYHDFHRKRPQHDRWGRRSRPIDHDATLAEAVPFYLDDDKEAPFGAILEVIGWTAYSDVESAEGPGAMLGYFRCRKPGVLFQSRYLVNIGGDTPANEFGLGSWAWEPTPVLVTEDVVGPQMMGSAADSWRLRPGLPGFRVLKTFDDQTAIAIQEPHPVVFGVLEASLGAGGNAPVAIVSYRGGLWRKTTRAATAYDFWLNSEDEPLEAGTKVRLETWGAHWIVTQAYCDVAVPALSEE